MVQQPPLEHSGESPRFYGTLEFCDDLSGFTDDHEDSFGGDFIEPELSAKSLIRLQNCSGIVKGGVWESQQFVVDLSGHGPATDLY